ncbi:DEAD/DEAH box helicase [Paraburkholderia lycopersici]|uniref:ATP-dependent helicase Lhr and Lhr-like helicase n=1 Tax=Paraburkholderia lycopersici TaxID=416944 RepID=A0A1G6RI60_9BURK|nr:DEAD/DEAH box helicase [Paraburkholderia lycopersici]SDD04350.1 ATP-dependent helicase Lhr and Lhr-like helicase [Paraburkholderia lycopersici]
MALSAPLDPPRRPNDPAPAADDDGAGDVLARFHPAVAGWFRRSFDAPTAAQRAAWPLVASRRATLVAAPTGSGKTLTAFLAALDELVREGLANGGALPDATLVVYVSPLKALSNDIRLNLERPLEGIGAELARLGLPPVEIRTAVRTGDTPQPERAALRKRAPHILVTTPESLYVLLGSESGRRMLASTRSVIVDEIHALAGNKRGCHLALSLERLDALCGAPLLRVGLSATQKPIETVARFLVGMGEPRQAPRACEIVDVGHTRTRDLAIEMPPVPLEAVMANDVWERVYDRMAELVAMHRTTLVFVNTRRMAERVARHLTDRLGAEAVAAHHGSLAREHRFLAEQRLKRGELRVLVATASLELGIDIGDVDLVCQIGSPRSIAAFLQRVGRSGHQVGGVPKGRLFPTSRDDLIECAALLDSVRRGELDRLATPHAPLDVLAQQIVAEVACEAWEEDALYALVRRATPWANLERAQFDAVLRMLAEGYTSRHGPRAAYLHRDVVSHTLRARRGARLVALTSGGTIPDNADYAVLLEPQSVQIGTVNEDFAVESLAGDVFQLGNASYRILRIEAGRVRVEDAQGQPPNIPFWLGEAPGRSDELSFAISRLRKAVEAALADASTSTADDAPSPAVIDRATATLAASLGMDDAAVRQIVEYLARARAALSVLPTQDTLVMERFFDEAGGTQLVIHAPFGSRLNRAWGLALRKRFCRQFNFELQAAATEDAIILSLTGAHSFALDEVWRYLHSNSAEHLLVQALLDAPLFGVRWRWNATTALALPRQTGGRKTPPQIQRMRSEDLLAAVFPDQVACVENIVGEREVPRHPLVDQTLDDCLHDAMDTEAWLALLRRIEAHEVRLVTRELPAPSPLAAEILTARPYAFLDDAPLEERRTQAVLSRRWSDPESTDDLGALDPEAIASVRDEAWPQVRDADEMHDALTSLGALAESEAQREPQWLAWLAQLAAARRATRLPVAQHDALWVGVERLACVQAIYPQAQCEPPLAPPPEYAQTWTEDAALVEIVRARLSGFGPLTVAQVARPLALEASVAALALTRLEAEGTVMRGRFTPHAMGGSEEEWCERHLLARIHRYTVRKLRREIEPVERHDFMRFLFEWQRVAPGARGSGREALAAVLDQLEGWEASALAWEDEILPARVDDYTPTLLDDLCRSGRLAWARLPARAAAASTVRSTPVVLLSRRELARWTALVEAPDPAGLSARARRVYEALLRHGAMFFDELAADAHLLGVELENALGELVAAGLVNADSFAGLRALVKPAAQRNAHHGRRRPRGFGPLAGGMADAGRWATLRRVQLHDALAEPRPDALTAPQAAAADDAAALVATRSPASHAAAEGNALPRAQALARARQTANAARRPPADPELLEHVANVLLRRYGVIGWHLLGREAPWLPPWRDLLRVLHRMEARGDVRGGRFVTGISGEQFALPEAVALLRDVRRRGPTQGDGGALVCVSAADPLNLLGSLMPGEKVPALTGNRIVFRDGVPIATLVAGRFSFLGEFDESTRAALRAHLAKPW